MAVRIIEGETAKALGQDEKWRLLAPFLKRHGREALAYATLQPGMEYFIDEAGYLAYTTVRHPILARRSKQITFSDPVCAHADLTPFLRRFLQARPRAVFGLVSERCAEILRGMGFKVNCVGYECELPVQTYNTQGDWKELDLIKRARNEARREGIAIRETSAAHLRAQDLVAVSRKWIAGKKINDREIWLYARRPVFDHEEDVRKFVAYDREGRVVGFVFYDPIYRDGEVIGYAANISRCDEQRFGRLATAIHMQAMEQFRAEGREVLNLLLAPFAKLEQGRFNDDWVAKMFFKLAVRYGNSIYNFQGLAFHKSKYRGREKYLYYASRSLWPVNDIYLAFRSAEITRSYLAIVGRLFCGMCTALWRRSPGRSQTATHEERAPDFARPEKGK